MAKVPPLGNLPKKHPIHSAAEEKSERALRQAEDENREFYERSQEIAGDVSLIQTGTNEKVARALTRGMTGPMGENPVLTRIKEERVQSELYRAVQGNELIETEKGEDSKNYLGSANYEHLDSGLLRRGGRQFMRVLRGAGSMIGTNNYIEAQLENRFGANKAVEARRRFVAERMRPALSALNTAFVDGMLNLLGRPVNPATRVDELVNAFTEARLSQLREIRDWDRTNSVDFCDDNAAFRDLMLLVDLDQRESSKIGIMEVYDHQRLRKFWHDLHAVGGDNERLASLVEDVLEQNSLFPLENNPEGTALLAEIRARMHRSSAVQVINEIETIRAEELPAPDLDESENQKLEADRKELSELNTEVQTILFSLDGARNRVVEAERRYSAEETNLRNYVTQLTATLNAEKTNLESQIVSIENQLSPPAGSPAPILTAQVRGSLNQSLVNLRQELRKLNLDITDLQVRQIDSRVVEENRKDLNEARENRKEAKKELNDLQTKARELSQKITNSDVQRRIQLHWNVLDPVKNFLGSTNFADLSLVINFTTEIGQANAAFMKLNGELIEKKTVPFTLLQRLMRRDYYEGRGLDPAVFNTKFNEEANHYALIKAGLRVQDVKNVDLMRTSNDKAATFLRRGRLRRGVDKLVQGVGVGQNILGLEPFEILQKGPDRILQEIIDSEPEFAVFKGVDKFTTTRDLRQVLNKTGEEVKPETIERFAQILEEAVSIFKNVPPGLETGLRYYDWDLENLVLVLQKMRVEMWSRNFLSKVERSGEEGEREQVLIRMLKGERQVEEKINSDIRTDVKSPDAMWRKLMVKNELKRILDKNALEGMNKVREAGIEYKNQRIAKLESQMSSHAEGSPERLRMEKEITNLRRFIATAERQISDSKDLYDRVETAKKYLLENKLSRRDRKKYLQEMGLTQVYDKMATNFRMQKTWHYTKRGGAALWSGTKKSWAWSRKKFLNYETAKSGAKKSWSVLRIGATPVTWPLGLAWKAGTFPFRLVGRATVRATHMPKRMLGVFSKNMMRSYIRDRVANISEKVARIEAKQARLKAKLARVPYSWDKKRINRQMNKLEEEKMALNLDKAEYEKMASDKQIEVGPIHFYNEAANDNADSTAKAA